MRILKILVLSLATVTWTSIVMAAQSVASNAKPDVRLLIDISGSMKKNDPNNLRVPALQLVTNLLPQGSEAGVWAFGRYVNMMVRLAPVDAQWQENATKSATKINSAGLYTNIGGVLEKASYGWSKPNPSEKRSLILLTDGMVDISKDPKVNAKERERILNQILPKLVNAKVSIHTIALSKNADHELLKTLSTQTDGWYQAVESAEELQKVFLKIFEQSAARDSLPLTDNNFNVDASIEEMTLLVFKQDPLEKVRLVAPDKSVIEDASPDGSVRWFTTAGYDLVTVKSPAPGAWQIDAKVDPDNRVMVVSKLGLDVAPVPNNLLAGEAINYQVGLLEDGKPITKPDFLSLVEARLVQSKQGQTSRLAMFYDSGNHQFKQNFFTDSFEGVLQLTLEVKSPTFERTRNHAINIYGSPLQHQVEISDQETKPHAIHFTVRDDIVQSESLKVNATVTQPDGEKQYMALEDFDQPIELRVSPAGGDYAIALDIKGKSIVGRDFSVSPEPIVFSTSPTPSYLLSQQAKPQEEEVKEVVEEPDAPAEEEKKPEEEEEKPAEPTEEAVEQPEPEEEVDWTFWLIVGGGANLILIILGFFGWRFIKKKGQHSSALLANELGVEDDDDDEDDEDDDE
ncbi:VWA domain-containing protein [Aliikangiella coralliicola]|uniref:VWA domain-containing protein n=1 Tax=Aliikangiella coralliicola TaxID=2592383 RepID=A0A545U0J5_9GAMM|nr:vWA domain-containing protein [Aliikangiella coralliicola]TQV82982.1 VWA domain-containing protein [Aliikangiella coralliicola]